MTASRPRNSHERNLERHLGEMAHPLPAPREGPVGRQDAEVADRLAREAVMREAIRRAHLRPPDTDLH